MFIVEGYLFMWEKLDVSAEDSGNPDRKVGDNVQTFATVQVRNHAKLLCLLSVSVRRMYLACLGTTVCGLVCQFLST